MALKIRTQIVGRHFGMLMNHGLTPSEIKSFAKTSGYGWTAIRLNPADCVRFRKQIGEYAFRSFLATIVRLYLENGSRETNAGYIRTLR